MKYPKDISMANKPPCKACKKIKYNREKATELKHCIHCHGTWENYIEHIKQCANFLEYWEDETGRPLVADKKELDSRE